jgi:hypothetical protein
MPWASGSSCEKLTGESQSHQETCEINRGVQRQGFWQRNCRDPAKQLRERDAADRSEPDFEARCREGLAPQGHDEIPPPWSSMPEDTSEAFLAVLGEALLARAAFKAANLARFSSVIRVQRTT